MKDIEDNFRLSLMHDNTGAAFLRWMKLNNVIFSKDLAPKKKRGAKAGTRRNPEMICLEVLKIGKHFYSDKPAKDITAIASNAGRKVKTEVVYSLHPRTLLTTKIIKATIIK